MAQDEKDHHPQDPVPVEKIELAQLQVQEHDQESLTFDTQADQSSSSLPTPATTPSKPQRPKIPAAAIIPVWIVLSSTVILYNNRVYNTYGFHYPVFLVTWHLTFAVSHLSFLCCRHLTCLRDRLLAQECFSGRPICLTALKTSLCLDRCSCAPFSPLACSSVAASSSATLPIFISAYHTSRCSRYVPLHKHVPPPICLRRR
jgi:hypothetical protein